MSNTKPCSRADRNGRMKKAEDFWLVAGMILDLADDEEGDLADPYITMVVHAGIAAADVICCVRLGEHSNSTSHSDAVKLLNGTVDKDISKHLGTLLGMKSRSGYSSSLSTRQDCVKAGRAAEALINRAHEAIASAG